jgi:hypothetical protein
MNSISPYFAGRRTAGKISLRRTDSVLAFGALAHVYYMILVGLGWGVLAFAVLRVVVTLMGT